MQIGGRGQGQGRGPGNTNTLNTDNWYHFLNSQEPNTLKIDDLHTNNSLSEKLLSINFDCKLKFNKPITDICQKVSQKLNVLVRLAPYNQKTYFYEYILSKHSLIIRCYQNEEPEVTRSNEK